jgi:hypothetical protein
MSRKTFSTAHLRCALKIVRDPTKNAYDHLSSGETIGNFANIYAVERYRRKVESKRERARETRKLKRKIGILYNSKKEYCYESAKRESV